MTDTNTRDKLILDWQAATEQLAFWRDREKDLREQVVAAVWNRLPAGIHRQDLGAGYKLKATVRNHFRVQRQTEDSSLPPYANVMSALSRIPLDLANTIINWKPELSERVYKTLTADEKKIVNTFLVITESTPLLELELPKVRTR